MPESEFFQQIGFKPVGRYFGHSGVARRDEIGGASTTFERGTFAHHGAWTYASDHLTVDSNVEVAIQHHRDRRGLFGLAKEELTGSKPPNRWTFTAPHDLLRERPFQV